MGQQKAISPVAFLGILTVALGLGLVLAGCGPAFGGRQGLWGWGRRFSSNGEGLTRVMVSYRARKAASRPGSR